MTVVLYMAISADGFIAASKDETPWSDDEWTAFQSFLKTCDTVLLGRRTYEIMRGQSEFLVGPEYVVITNDTSLDTGSFPKLSIKTQADLPQVKKLGVIGGGELNGSLATLGVIDELILDVEPIVLGTGKHLFGENQLQLNLELIESRNIGAGTVQNHYLVKSKES